MIIHFLRKIQFAAALIGFLLASCEKVLADHIQIEIDRGSARRQIVVERGTTITWVLEAGGDPNIQFAHGTGPCGNGSDLQHGVCHIDGNAALISYAYRYTHCPAACPHAIRVRDPNEQNYVTGQVTIELAADGEMDLRAKKTDLVQFRDADKNLLKVHFMEQGDDTDPCTTAVSDSSTAFYKDCTIPSSLSPGNHNGVYHYKSCTTCADPTLHVIPAKKNEPLVVILEWFFGIAALAGLGLGGSRLMVNRKSAA